MGIGGGNDEEDDDSPKIERPTDVHNTEDSSVDEEPTEEPVEEVTTSDTDCPHGFPFGDAVHGDHKECDDCPERMYMSCVKAARKR